MLAEVNWIFAIPASIFGIFSLIVAAVFCICGWKTKEPKDELVGVEGRVKITNPEEFLEEVNANNIKSELIGDKGQNSAKRSLPDLPVDSQANERNNVNWEPTGDAASELYATVVLQDEKNKKHNRQKSDSDSISPSLTYTKVKKDHPYDKLKKVEHPYAQVKDHESEKRTFSASHVSNINEEEGNDVDELEGNLVTTIRCGNESTGNIPAATAITGHISASDDLPYMTPPAHFSGDSQDSGKGYTSISVREPLSAIQAGSKPNSNQRPDSHYTTVSDDSDDMYAAIDDPNQTYTSESETYAQIHSRSNRPKSAPQPPSVDSLKQMTTFTQSHSRQASSSSLASSTVISSPKPEKRPANSPLPPTPTKSPDSTENSSQSGDNNLRQSVSPRNVEDMYAKVNKKIRREVDQLERGGSTESGVSESSDSLSFKLQTTSTTESSRSCHSYLSKSTLTDTTSSCSSNGQITTDIFSSETDPRSGYEKLDASSFEFDRKSDPGYETVNKGPSSESDPEYEKLKPQKHDYINVDRTKSSGRGLYASVSDKMEVDGSDGYARVKVDAQENEIYSKIDACGSDGYARVEPHEMPVADDGYAKVLKHNNNGTEASYERVFLAGKSLAHADEEQMKHSVQVTEPTYESLGNELESDDLLDPNYESVRFTGQKAQVEPPYQLLRECESGGAVPET